MAEHVETDQAEKAGESALNPVEALIERFGGLRPMAEKLGVPVSTVQGWKKRAAIPANRVGELRAAAERHHIVLTEADMEGAFRHEERGDDHPAEKAASPAAAESAPSPAAAAPPPVITPPPVATSVPQFASSTSCPPVSNRAVCLLATGAMALSFVAGVLAMTVPSWSPSFGYALGLAESLDTRVDQLEKRLGTGSPTSAPLRDRITALEKSAAAIETLMTTVPEAVNLIAVRDLRFLLTNGGPFYVELTVVRRTGTIPAPAQEALNAVAGRSQVGVPTNADLVASFNGMAAAVARAEVMKIDSGLGDRLLGWAAGVAGSVQVAVTGDTKLKGTGSRLALAGAKLDAGDVRAAIDIVSAIGGPGNPAAAQWLTNARLRLAANEAGDLLQAYLVDAAARQ